MVTIRRQDKSWKNLRLNRIVSSLSQILVFLCEGCYQSQILRLLLNIITM